MKTKFKILVLLFAVIASLLYTSCEKDLYDDAIKKESKDFRAKKISFKEFKQNKKALHKLRESILKKNVNIQNRGVYFEAFGVYVDTTDIRIVEDIDKHSITFRITNQEVNNKIENLVLQSKDNGEYEAFIAEYVLTQTEMYQISLDQYNEIEKNPDAIIKLESSERVAINSECVSIVTITTIYCKDNDGNLYVSQGNLGDCPTPSHEETFVVVSISAGCLNQYGGTFGSSFTGDNGSTDSSSGSSGGGIGVGSPSTGINDNPVITTPILNLEEIEANIISILEPDQLTWWNSQPASNNIKHQIRYFFSSFEITEENQEFVNQVINQIIQQSYTNIPLSSDITLFDDVSSSQINNLQEYLECFNLYSGAVFTIYVDQPTPNNNESWSGNPLDPNVGHTFISIKQGDIRRLIGFYPGSSVSLGSPSTNGIYRNDSGHSYDVALSFNINAEQLGEVINYISSNLSSNYNLNTYNCTDFGMGACKKAGVSLASAYGTWGLPGIGSGAGDNPGQLGQNIRSMPIPSGAVKTVNSGTAASNSGTCN